MSQMHEQLVRDFGQMILGKIPDEYIDVVTSCLIISVDKYEVTERCTELALQDDSNEYVINMYLTNCRIEGKRKKTVIRYKDELTKFSHSVGKRFDEVTTFDIRKYFAQMISRGNSNRTVENVRSCLSPFFRWMAAEEVIQKDPMIKIKPIKHEKNQEDPFSEIEISMLRDAAADPLDRALIEFLLATGARVSEVVNMKKSDIDFKDNTVNIRDGKGGKDRKTYITDVAIRYLQIYLNSRTDDSDLLFVGKKGTYTTNGIRNRLNVIASRACVENVHPHRFRHTMASNLARAGMTLQEIQILLGHANIETTRLYVTTTQDQVKSRYMQVS